MAKWKPNLNSVKVKRSRKGALDYAFLKVGKINIRYKLGLKYQGDIKDNYGRIGIELNNYILVAKNYPYGYIVSIAESIIDYAEEKKKDVLLYLKNSDKIYLLKTKDILKNNSKNVRGKTTMLNFKIQLGKNLEKFSEEQEKAKQTKLL